MVSWIFRGLFLMAWSAAAYAIGSSLNRPFDLLVLGILSGLVLIAAEMALSGRPVSLISSVLFGTLVGMLGAALTVLVIELAFGEVPQPLKRNLTLALVILFVYLGVTFLYETRDRFRLIIPYVEFRPTQKGARPVLLDTSVVVDGRVAELLRTGVIDGPIVVADIVLRELHSIADSEDKLKRERGRLGLSVLNDLREERGLDVRVERHDSGAAEPVDEQLVQIARKLNARIMTNDYNLNRLATLEGVEIINLNELANALKPIALPDEKISVRLVKRGEQPGQAVGYLQDGTMVVVEEAAHALGSEVEILVTNTITRETGRMIFGRLAGAPRSGGR